MSDAVSVLVDYSNGVTKSFAQIVYSDRMSVTQALDAAALIPPGLTYEFDADFVDRGGRNVGTITAVDGVGEMDDKEWGVWLNGRVVGSLRQVVPESTTPFGDTRLEPGDSILVKLVAS